MYSLASPFGHLSAVENRYTVINLSLLYGSSLSKSTDNRKRIQERALRAVFIAKTETSCDLLSRVPNQVFIKS